MNESRDGYDTGGSNLNGGEGETKGNGSHGARKPRALQTLGEKRQRGWGMGGTNERKKKPFSLYVKMHS